MKPTNAVLAPHSSFARTARAVGLMLGVVALVWVVSHGKARAETQDSAAPAKESWAPASALTLRRTSARTDATAQRGGESPRPFAPAARVRESLIAQASDSTGGGAGSSSGGATRTSANPPGFYVPVRPQYKGREYTVRATAFTGNWDLFSLSFALSRHPVFDLEFGVWANPLWCSDFIDKCRPGVTTTAWGGFVQFGISRQLADQRGIRRRAWSFEVPFHLELRYLNGDKVSTGLWGVHIGIEFIRWFRPSVGLALKITGGSEFVDIITWNLQTFELQLRGSVGVTF